MPGIVWNLYVYYYLILTTAPGGGFYYYLQFRDEETDIERVSNLSKVAELLSTRVWAQAAEPFCPSVRCAG